MSNVILEQIHLVQTFNVQQTYVEENDRWTGIVSTAAFGILPTTSRQKGHSLGQLIFGHDMILLIKHRVDW